MQRALKLLSLLALFLISPALLPSTTAWAAPSAVVSTLSGLPKQLPSDSRLIIRTFRLSDGAVTKTIVKRRVKQFSMVPPSTPSIVGVSFLSRSTRKALSGVSKKFMTRLSKKQLRSALTIKLKAPTTRSRATTRSTSRAAATNKLLVGIPVDGITVSGPGTFPAMARSQIQLLQTSLVNESSCYNKDTGFVLIDLDPEVQRARDREFDLCSSGKADPATCVQNAFEAPSRLIKGSLTTDGTVATLTLSITNAAGIVVSQTTSTGSIKTIAGWESLTTTATRQLNSLFCDRGALEVNFAQCVTPTCNYSCGTTPAIRTLPTIRGSAQGPVGSGIQVGMFRDFATINCGAWSVDTCAANVCCKRTSDSQPESTTFEAVLDLFQGMCICPTGGEPVVYDMVSQLTGQNPIEIGNSIECPA